MRRKGRRARRAGERERAGNRERSTPDRNPGTRNPELLNREVFSAAILIRDDAEVVQGR